MPPDPAKIGFRPVTENDLPMLECWLAAPHVAAWWDAPQEGARKIADHISDPTVDPLLVEGNRNRDNRLDRPQLFQRPVIKPAAIA